MACLQYPFLSCPLWSFSLFLHSPSSLSTLLSFSFSLSSSFSLVLCLSLSLYRGVLFLTPRVFRVRPHRTVNGEQKALGAHAPAFLSFSLSVSLFLPPFRTFLFSSLHRVSLRSLITDTAKISSRQLSLVSDPTDPFGGSPHTLSTHTNVYKISYAREIKGAIKDSLLSQLNQSQRLKQKNIVAENTRMCLWIVQSF